VTSPALPRTERLYHHDPYLLDFEATVTGRRQHEGRLAVTLDRTAFYPESGGQPFDTGTLSGVPVLAVIEEAHEVLHVLAAPLKESRVRGQVDGERRRDHRQQHHGQHLLSRAFSDLFSAHTVSFHLGAEASSIDLDREVSEEQVRLAEVRTNGVVWEARPVEVKVVSRAEARALGVEPPPEAGEAIRLVEAQGFDLQPCGGTHPRSTAEVGVVLVLGRERYKGGSRVRFVCGHRALATFGERTAVLDRLGALLCAPLPGLPEAAQRALAALAESTRQCRVLQERALEGEARRLLATAAPPAVVVSVYERWPPEDLRTLATQLVALSPCVALLGSRGDKAHLVFAQSPGLPHDIPALLKAAVETLGGRGGGRGDLAQGGGERPALLDEALARAADAVRTKAG
jgi:alanyl-tRNA synthetase